MSSTATPTSTSSIEAFLSRAAAIVGESHLSTAPDDLATYGRDWTKVHAPAPSAVLFPRTTDEVAAIVRAANELDVPLVPSGGRTGLAAGAVAARGEVVLSLERMRSMHCAPHGLTWPVDFASKGSSTRRRQHRDQRRRREGDPLRPHAPLGARPRGGHRARARCCAQRRAREEQHGHRPAQLFIGSEGTLGVVTEGDVEARARARAGRRRMLFAVPTRRRAARSFARRERRRSPSRRTSSSPTAASRACEPPPRPRARPSRRARVLTCCSRSRTQRRMTSSRPGSRSRSRRGVLDGTVAQNLAPGGRLVGAAREHQREPLGDGPAPQERRRAAHRVARALLRRPRGARWRAPTPAGSSACSATSATATCTST
jgi:hypothetical protein